jgi:hypothetical protein
MTTSAYESTRVPVPQSRREIEGLLEKRGVRDYRVTTSGALFALDFNWPLKDRRGQVRAILGVRLVSPWPDDDKQRRRMARVLYWHLKSKLETVEAGLLSFEEEFLPHLTLGRAGPRVWDDAKPAIEAAIAKGQDLSHDLMGTSRRALQLGDGKGL